MITINKEEYKNLNKEEQNAYLITYVSNLIETSIKKQQSSENYKLPAWPYMQAEQLGTQKVLNKLLNIIKYD